MMGARAVPLAVRLPWATVRLVAGAKSRVVPGWMVSVALPVTTML